MRVELSDHHASWLAEQANRSGCRDTGEYLERLIGDERARQELEKTLLDALDSGEPKEMTPAFWQDLRDRL